MNWKEELAAYQAALEARMEKGEKEYGDRSWDKPPLELLVEIQEELLDVAGWSGIMWLRLERMREALSKKKGMKK